MESWLQDSIEDDKIKASIDQLIKAHPDSKKVIQDIIQYYENKLDSEQGDKKRKRIMDNNKEEEKKNKEIISSISDISFQLPARKKYTLAITSSSTLQLINEKTQQIEYEYNIQQYHSCICVPTPDKPQGSFTFSLFSNPSEKDLSDTIVFNLLEKGTMIIKQRKKEDKIYTTPQEKRQAMIQFLIRSLFQEDETKMILPNKEYYTCSGVSPSTGKPELDRTFVTTYLRNKEGVLYFLPTGILYGFKKPTLFIPLTMISSTMITNITKRTFDLHFQFFPHQFPLGGGYQPLEMTFWTPFLQTDQDDEIEEGGEKKKKKTILSLPFSMIEQTEFNGIDHYIKKMGITDQSMTEATKAPEPIHINKKEKGKGIDRGDHQDDDDDEEEEEEKNSFLFNHDDEDSEDDVDFEPGNHSDDDALEYDSNASDDNDGEMNHDEEEEDEDELDDD